MCDIAWSAGLLEGEGTFGIDKRWSKKSTSIPLPYIKIAMVDEDVIAKFSQLFHKRYFSPKRLTSSGKQVFICHIGDRKTLISLLPRLLPYMGLRRKERILECIHLLSQWEQRFNHK